jgi:hypothetical protein
MQTLVFLALCFLPPLIAGPLPTMLVLRMTSGPNWRRQLPLAILLAIILNLIAFAFIVSNLDGLLPPGFVACVLTPIAAVVTLIVALHLLRQTDPGQNVDPIKQRWLRVSLVAIMALQILMVVIVALVAPALCETGIRNCAPL